MLSEILLGRLRKEIMDLDRDPPPGITCYPKDDDLTKLEALIKGPPDSPYQGGLFKLSINIPQAYPFEPPQIKFVTQIYHPNIDDTGRICADILKKGEKGSWKPALNLSTTLILLCQLLADPNPDDPLDVDIAREFKLDYPSFRQKAEELTRKFGNAEAVMASVSDDHAVVPENGETEKDDIEEETSQQERKKGKAALSLSKKKGVGGVNSQLLSSQHMADKALDKPKKGDIVSSQSNSICIKKNTIDTEHDAPSKPPLETAKPLYTAEVAQHISDSDEDTDVTSLSIPKKSLKRKKSMSSDIASSDSENKTASTTSKEFKNKATTLANINASVVEKRDKIKSLNLAKKKKEKKEDIQLDLDSKTTANSSNSSSNTESITATETNTKSNTVERKKDLNITEEEAKEKNASRKDKDSVKDKTIEKKYLSRDKSKSIEENEILSVIVKIKTPQHKIERPSSFRKSVTDVNISSLSKKTSPKIISLIDDDVGDRKTTDDNAPSASQSSPVTEEDSITSKFFSTQSQPASQMQSQSTQDSQQNIPKKRTYSIQDIIELSDSETEQDSLDSSFDGPDQYALHSFKLSKKLKRKNTISLSKKKVNASSK